MMVAGVEPLRAGFAGDKIPSQIAGIASGLCRLFVAKDATLCEINPLIVTADLPPDLESGSPPRKTIRLDAFSDRPFHLGRHRASRVGPRSAG
mgnify:CR=1 FL=1